MIGVYAAVIRDAIQLNCIWVRGHGLIEVRAARNQLGGQQF
jgi:hypothetical protein